MPVVEATLVKRYVDQRCPSCGLMLMEMKDEIQLGKVYRVKLETREVKKMFNVEHGVPWQAEMVEDADHPGEWLPTSLLMRNGSAL